MLLKIFHKYVLAFSMLCLPLALQADDEEKKDAKELPAACPSPATVKKAPTKEELFSDSFITRLSQTYGHLIQKSLSNPVLKLNPQEVIQGIQDGLVGKKAPLTEHEYEEALALIQQHAYDEQASKNLAEAESYLKKNAEEKGIVLLEDGKVQYKIIQEGTGEAVGEDTVPTINYTATYSNGQKLGSSEQAGGPIEIKLNDTIPGFCKGILGMKVGEKRQIFIHPDLGFGKSGQLPNGLLVFDIEVTNVAPKPADLADDEEAEDDDDDLSQLLGSDDLLVDDDDDDDDDDFEDLGDELESLQVEEIDIVETPKKK